MEMSRKLSKETVDRRIRESLKEHIKVDYNFEYLGSSVRNITCKCLIHEYTWKTSYHALMHLIRGCVKCNNYCLKLTQEKVEENLKNCVRETIKIDSFEYMGVNAKNIPCECLVCGHTWMDSYATLAYKIRCCPNCESNRPLTQEEAEKNLREKVSGTIKIYPFVFDKSSSKNIRCKCLIDGYTWITSHSRLILGFGCKQCTGTRKLTQKEASSRLKKAINKNIKIRPFKYKNAHTRNIQSECLICGHVWTDYYARLIHGTGCRKCIVAGRKINERLKKIAQLKNYNRMINLGYVKCNGKYKLSKDEVVKRLKAKVSKNVEIDYDNLEYVKCTNPNIECKCLIDGHTWKSSYSSLVSGKGCTKCANKNKLTKAEVVRKLKNNANKNVEIDYDFEYIRSHEKNIPCSCFICGYTWTSSYASLVHGHGCARCAGKIKFPNNQKKG